MGKKLKVSILIPTYNQEKYIKQAVLSALNQTYKNLEVIVSDDCSSDKTKDIVKELLEVHTNLKYYRNQKNLGRVKNYHKALYEYASGDLVLNLDADDYLCDENYILEAVKQFEKHDDIVLVYAKKKTLVEKTQAFIQDSNDSGKVSILDGNEVFINYYRGKHIVHMTSLYKRQYAIQIGYYTENIQSSDWESVLRLILNKKVAFIDKTIGAWRKHEQNASKGIEISSIVQNTRFIENAYQKAKDESIFSGGELMIWREKMLLRMFMNFLVKMHYLSSENVKLLWNEIKVFDRKIYKKVRYNLKYLFFKTIYKRKKLTRLIFKYLLKKESFISDLQ